MKRIITAVLVLSVLAVSCKKDHDNGIFRGPEVNLHHGKAWTWIQVDDQGNPERLGVTINDAAMNSLPIGGESGHNSMEDNNIVLPLHPKASNSLFNHVWLNWNPAGH